MSKFLPHIALTIVSFITLEVIMRLLCTVDSDGSYTFRSTRLKPYRIPVKHLEETILAYSNSDKSGPVYDAELGWALRPNTFNHNSAGFITSGSTPPLNRTEGKLRIALIGDSYTQGNFQSGWWRVLEEELNRAGVNAEVLNFGVAGYGLDQAYLRWQRDCISWKPQVVIYGFFVDDCARNLNLFRVLRDSTTGIPFTKPRFILEGDGLKLVNSPTPSPEELQGILHDLSKWNCLKHEHFYHPDDYCSYPWRWSRLGALLEAKLVQSTENRNAASLLKVQGEAGQISLRILRRMREEVKASGGSFFVASLPCQGDLELLRDLRSLPQDELLRTVKGEFDVISNESALLEITKGKGVSEFFGDGHYLGEANGAVGKSIAKFLIDWRTSHSSQ